jgi:hypothetical protein
MSEVRKRLKNETEDESREHKSVAVDREVYRELVRMAARKTLENLDKYSSINDILRELLKLPPLEYRKRPY